MACPSTGQITLYGVAKELELNNYSSTIPVSTYISYYADPVSLVNMSTGAGGFDSINTANSAANRPNGSSPHSLDEFYAYNHDQVAPTPPGINTTSASWNGSTDTASLQAYVYTTGTGSINKRGFVISAYNTTPVQNQSNTITYLVQVNSSNPFSTSVGLATGATYYVRGFAENTGGAVGYGNVRSFYAY
jgi:hypothetical protein